MFFYKKTTPGLAINSYLIGDESSGKAVVIDPTRDVAEIIEVAEKQRLIITDILETHVHADFVSGAYELKSHLKNFPMIHCSVMGGEARFPKYGDFKVKEGDVVSLGKIFFKARHTPGHTPEHLMWELYDITQSDALPLALFTGDFLFMGAVGRPDLLGDQKREQLAKQLYQSVFTILPGYSDAAAIYPAHGAGSLCGKGIQSGDASTLGDERRLNQALVYQEESDWIDNLMRNMPQAPSYCKHVIGMNLQTPVLLGDSLNTIPKLTAQQLKEALKDHPVLLDTREIEAFSAGHISGAIHIGLRPNFVNWVGMMIPFDQPLYLILDDDLQAEGVARQLANIGYDRIQGYLTGGMAAWQKEGYSLDKIPLLLPQEMALMIQKAEPGSFMILDVRNPDEWDAFHVKQAHHLPMSLFLDNVEALPRDKPIVVTCASGFRASIAASLLKRLGFKDVFNLSGGMQAWRQHFPAD